MSPGRMTRGVGTWRPGPSVLPRVTSSFHSGGQCRNSHLVKYAYPYFRIPYFALCASKSGQLSINAAMARRSNPPRTPNEMASGSPTRHSSYCSSAKHLRFLLHKGSQRLPALPWRRKKAQVPTHQTRPHLAIATRPTYFHLNLISLLSLLSGLGPCRTAVKVCFQARPAFSIPLPMLTSDIHSLEEFVLLHSQHYCCGRLHGGVRAPDAEPSLFDLVCPVDIPHLLDPLLCWSSPFQYPSC